MLPNDPVRGSEALTILNRALGANEQDSTASLAASQQNQWYISELGKAIHLNLIDAADSRNFANAATRAEAFVYIVRAFVYDRAESGTDELSVSPTPVHDHRAEAAAAALVASGVIKGDTATTLAPDKKLTRAEFVTMITRITGNISAEYTGAARRQHRFGRYHPHGIQPHRRPDFLGPGTYRKPLGRFHSEPRCAQGLRQRDPDGGRPGGYVCPRG